MTNKLQGRDHACSFPYIEKNENFDVDLCISNLMAASNSDQLLPSVSSKQLLGVVIYIHVINNSGVILVHGNSYFGVVIAVAKCRFFYVVLVTILILFSLFRGIQLLSLSFTVMSNGTTIRMTMEAKTETTENHKLITSFLTPIIMRIINANTAKNNILYTFCARSEKVR